MQSGLVTKTDEPGLDAGPRLGTAEHIERQTGGFTIGQDPTQALVVTHAWLVRRTCQPGMATNRAGLLDGPLPGLDAALAGPRPGLLDYF